MPSPRTSVFAGRNVMCVGIGGCGLSGLARMLESLGARCRGSDVAPTDVTRDLEADGIEVTFDQTAGRLPDDCDLVVASAAIPDDHAELLAARRSDIPILTYAETLGQAQAERTGISIAGTHGKSTTTAMLCHVLLAAGLDPSFIVGAFCRQIGGGSRTGAALVPVGPYRGRPGLLVVEACEFGRSFHEHHPVIATILNVEEDHLDVYGSLEGVIDAFRTFAARVPAAEEGGRLLIAHEGAQRRRVTAGIAARVETFGFSPAADYQIVADAGVRRVGLLQDGRCLTQWTNAMPGEHNALNAAAAAITAHAAGADWESVGRALDAFEGLDRRMERLGARPVRGGAVVVYDDYGHHPTEIDATLRSLRAAEQPRRLICIFQPHQHSRTRFLLDEFAQSFSSADVVIVPEIYFVRDSEIERQRVSSVDLVERLRRRGVRAMHLAPFDAIVEHLEILCTPGDLVVIMGAGPVWEIGRRFMDAARTPEDAASDVPEAVPAAPAGRYD